MKDNNEKRKSQLLEQEAITENENSQTKTTEKANSAELEHKDVDVPLHKPNPDIPLESDSTPNSGKDSESNKSNGEKKSDDHTLHTNYHSIHEAERNVTTEAYDFQLEMGRAKRSQSLSSKIQSRAPIRRAISNLSQNSYSKLQRYEK